MLSGFLTLNVQLSWLSGRALVAQARGVLGLTPGDCQPFHSLLFSLYICSTHNMVNGDVNRDNMVISL